MSRLERQVDNEFKDHFIRVTLQSNSSHVGRFVECTENGFIGIYAKTRPNALSNITKVYMYFPKEIIQSIEFII